MTLEIGISTPDSLAATRIRDARSAATESGRLAMKIRATLRGLGGIARPSSRSCALGVSSGLLALVATAGVAVAATSSENSETLQEVVVTGSRIATPELETFAPTMVVTSAAIENTGTIDMSTTLRDLPSVGTS